MYKTLMTHVLHKDGLAEHLEQCTALAQNMDAHLEVICHGVNQLSVGFHYGAADPMMVQQSMVLAKSDAAELAEAAKGILAKTDVRWGVETAVNYYGTLSSSVAQRSRFADLIILPPPYTEGDISGAESIIEGALFDGQSSILVLPKSSEKAFPPKRVVVAWNESAEALNAIRAALPLLKMAAHVSVTVIDPPQHGPGRSDPGGLVSQFLSRHGIRVEVDILTKTLPRISEVLARHATDIGADMIVMGAYGHSRFREAILGGATRNTLENVDVPVFMTH